MKNIFFKFTISNFFLIAILTTGPSASFAQPDLSPNQRYFDTTSNRLHETCIAFDGGYYSAKFSLISSESGFSMTLDNPELLASLANVRSLPREELDELWALNDSERAEIEIKDCSSILVDWWC